jgi:hypothetical protein
VMMLGVEGADQSLIDQFGPWVIPGAIALIGVWLGKLWERGGAHSAWLKDKQLAAYAGLAAALEEARNRAYRATADTTPAGRTAMSDDMKQFINSTLPMYAEIEILGPERVFDASTIAITSLIAFHDAVGAACVAAPPGDRVPLPATEHAEFLRAKKDYTTKASEVVT